MGRLIDSDVAIEYLGKELRGDAYARAYTAIDKTPTAQQWIPVHEKHPKDREEIIVTVDDGGFRYTEKPHVPRIVSKHGTDGKENSHEHRQIDT